MKFNKGDYVVATKWYDGDPKDQFCVGFFDRMYGNRYLVVDADNQQFRANGFRRIRRVRQDVGRKLVDNIKNIEDGGKSVWSWVRKFEREH